MTESRARLLLGVVLPVGLIAFGSVPFLALRSELPERLATHYNSSGVPDGSMTPAALAVVVAAVVLVSVALCMVAAFRRTPLPHALGPGMASLGAFLAGLFATILAGTAVTQRGLTDWQDAGGPGWVVIVALLVGLAAAALAAKFAIVLPSAKVVPPDGVSPVLHLEPGERAVWSSSTTSGLLLAMGVAFALFLGLQAFATSNMVAFVGGLCVAGVLLATARVRVRADSAGLHIKYGLLPWPRTHLAVGEIASASVIDVRPREWGGWGYRGSLKFMNQAAVVHRAGPGIRLDLKNGKVFVVTVDNPETPVALLNGEIARLANGIAA